MIALCLYLLGIPLAYELARKFGPEHVTWCAVLWPAWSIIVVVLFLCAVGEARKE